MTTTTPDADLGPADRWALAPADYTEAIRPLIDDLTRRDTGRRLDEGSGWLGLLVRVDDLLQTLVANAIWVLIAVAGTMAFFPGSLGTKAVAGAVALPAAIVVGALVTRLLWRADAALDDANRSSGAQGFSKQIANGSAPVLLGDVEARIDGHCLRAGDGRRTLSVPLRPGCVRHRTARYLVVAPDGLQGKRAFTDVVLAPVTSPLAGRIEDATGGN